MGKFLLNWHCCKLASLSLDLGDIKAGSRSCVGVFVTSSGSPQPVSLLVASNCHPGDVFRGIRGLSSPDP